MLTAAISADPGGLLIAFGAGVLSFLSPCVLPLVPGYLSLVSGLSAAEIEAAPAPVPAPDPPTGAGGTATLTRPAPAAAPPSPPLTPLLRGIGLFVAGFTVVFVALGAAASGLGHLLGPHKQQLAVVAGALILVLGLVLLAGAVPARAWARLGTGRLSGLAGRVLGEHRFQLRPATLGTWAAPVMGMAFAFAWTPCIGPVLGAILTLATAKGTVAGGALLLLAYSLGLGVPFLVTGLALGKMTAVWGRARRGLWVVHLVSGAVLVAFGLLLVTGQLAWLATTIGDLMRHLGLGRLSRS